MIRVRTVVWIACTLALLCVFVSPLRGQTTASAGENTPEAVVTGALTALKENRIADFAALMHPEALKQVKGSLLAVVDAAEEKERVEEVLRIFNNVTSADDLRQLDDVAFFTAFFEGVLKMQPRLRNVLGGMTLNVIGHVPEGADILHVVYRGTFTQGDIKFSKMEVMSLKAHGEAWGMLLTGDLEGMTQALKRQFDAGE